MLQQSTESKPQISLWNLACGACVTKGAATVVRTKPDFTGHWICKKFEGNADELLADLDVSMMGRLLARIGNYGAGSTTRKISQNDDELDIEVRGRKSFTQMLTIGGGLQVTEEEDSVIMVDPKWEHGCVLRFDITEQDGSKNRILRYYLQGDDMLLTVLTPAGSTASWRYARVSTPRITSRADGRAPMPTAEIPEPPPQSCCKEGRPDFTGEWQSYQVEGDPETFFKELGLGWPGSKALEAMNWGVGKIKKKIQQRVNSIQIHDEWPTGKSTMELSIGAGEQPTLGMAGNQVFATPDWEHVYILRIMLVPQDRSPTSNGPIRYYFKGENLVMRLESVSGCVVKYLFHRS